MSTMRHRRARRSATAVRRRNLAIKASNYSAMILVSALGLSAASNETLAADCDGSQLLVSGFSSNNAHIYDACTGTYQSNLDDGNGLTGTQAIVRGPDGNLYVVSEGNDRVMRYDGTTLTFIDNFVWDNPGTPEDDNGPLDGPTGLAFAPSGNLLVGSFNTDNILEYDGTTGAYLGEFVTAGSGGLNAPDAGMTYGPDGNLYVPGWDSGQVHKYDGTTGADLGPFITFVSRPRTVLFSADGSRLFVSAWGANRVQEFDPGTGDLMGQFVNLVGEGGRPTGMAYGPDRNLYVTSDAANRVWQIDPDSGAILDTFVSANAGGLSGATFVFFTRGPKPIPAVSTWGLAAMAISLLIGATLLVSRARPVEC